MTKVILYGELATALGQAEWAFVLSQPREAIAALDANTKQGLTRFLQAKHDESGGAAEYRFIVDGVDYGRPGEPGAVTADFYTVGIFLRIEIVPVLRGAGGIWQTIIGVVLIIVGVILFFVPGAKVIAPYVLLAGISLTLGGISQLLTPTPKLGAGVGARAFANLEDSGQKKEEAKNSPSYLFSGATNTTQQGNPVPICYGGPIVVGSALVSLGITGSTIDQTVIGGQKPAAPADAFYALPVWTRLAADPRRAAIETQKKVKQLGSAATKLLAPTYDLPTNFPNPYWRPILNGKPIPVGNANLARQSLKGLLSTVSFIFSGDPRPIIFAEAVDLCFVLGLGLDTPVRQPWKAVIQEIALHYSPDP